SCGADLRLLWANRTYAEWTGGLSPSQLVGRSLPDVIGQEAFDAIRPHVREVVAGRRVEYERYAQWPGEPRWVRVSLDPTFGAGGEVTGWVAVLMDIDESKRAAEALRATQEQLQVITDTMSAGACRTGNDLRYQWVNPVYARWFGRSAGELVGQPVADVLGQEAMKVIAPYLARVMKGEQVQYERLGDFPGLGRRWVSSVFTPIIDAAGQVDGWVTIVTDIHDRRQVEESLREAGRRKDDFLATLAHELRNPLAPISNAVAILGRKGGLDAELAWSRDVIARQVEQMSRLIDDLLDIERISRGKFLVRKERILLERAIDMALEISRPYITGAGHHLSVLVPSERIEVDADPARLAQVFSNLLNNAAKFTAPGGRISLSAELDGDGVVVHVEDNGVGFPPDLAPRLFKPYAQLAAARERTGGGLGIGLSLVDGIVALHGGRVEAKSEGPGRGATFSVRLPVAALSEPREAGPAARAPVPPPGTRILVADDNVDAADSLQRILAFYGYAVKTAYDGAAALAAAGEFRPRIAVLDIGMPKMDGYELARELRSRHGRAITLVALTGWGQEHDRRRSAEAGFDFHLTKPLDPNLLNDLLAEVSTNEKNTDRGVAARMDDGGGR
ncbi:MAG TPA: PAS domain-containing protein, partial [Myxococcota bacterium]|nr:PAS domain-containing protein [Myxococcota bacterium]